MKNTLFKHLATQIIINAHPSQFTFARPVKGFNLSVETFIYVAKGDSKWEPIAIGEEIPIEHKADPSIRKINLFDLNNELPSSITLSMNDLIQIFFEYGIGRCFEMSLLPQLRPVVFILGADKFSTLFENPREMFEKAARLGGAGIVVFDKTEL